MEKMIQNEHILPRKWRVLFSLTVLVLYVGAHSLSAQSKEKELSLEQQLKPLRSGVRIIGLTGSLRWYNTYTSTVNKGLVENSTTQLQVELRNLHMLSPQFGIGYRGFTSVFVAGFFDGVGLGSAGLGPLARFYPLETKRWQPYLQGNFITGYNIALGDALGANDVGGFRYRTGLRAGLNYKLSNAGGIFFDIGPAWEYDESFQLDSRAVQFNIGIELFRF